MGIKSQRYAINDVDDDRFLGDDILAHIRFTSTVINFKIVCVLIRPRSSVSTVLTHYLRSCDFDLL